MLSVAIQRKFTPDHSKQEAEQHAEEDWKTDSKGQEFMNYEMFFDAVSQTSTYNMQH